MFHTIGCAISLLQIFKVRKIGIFHEREVSCVAIDVKDFRFEYRYGIAGPIGLQMLFRQIHCFLQAEGSSDPWIVLAFGEKERRNRE